METGHHKVADVCEFVKARNIKRLIFNHHGREILRDPADAETRAKAIFPNASVANDLDIVEL